MVSAPFQSHPPRFGLAQSSPVKPLEVGVYLGSFNPIHNGHLMLARQAQKQYHLDAVEVVPLARPQHKQAKFMLDDHRFEMTRLAVQKEAKLHASRLDIDALHPTFSEFRQQNPQDPKVHFNFVLQRTLNLLDCVKRKYEQQSGGRPVHLNYIVGIDGLAGYPDAWSLPRYEQLVNKARFLVAPRPGAPKVKAIAAKIKKLYPQFDWDTLNVIPNPVSSREIRALMEAGKRIGQKLVPKAVADFLNRHGKSLLPDQVA